MIMPTPPTMPDPDPGEFGIVLTGGGARAAYQVGFLRCLARSMPQARIPIITGVSAGAINAAFLAAHPGELAEAVHDLFDLWSNLSAEKVFRTDPITLGRSFVRWGLKLASGGRIEDGSVRSLVDASPLRRLLGRSLSAVDGEIQGIARNLESGRLKALALTALDYTTGQTVTWVQGREIPMWQRPHRRSAETRMTVDHVLASAALPLVFPAVRLGDSWFGDGGIRLAAPLSPALHLGATRILAISTRYERTQEEADRPHVVGYPPPAQIIGQLLNSVFLDVLDQDVLRAERFNHLIHELPPEERLGMNVVDIVVLRPSQDLGRLAAEYEPELPKTFRFLTRGLGTRETESPDFLSLLMFQPDYLRKLIEIGQEDAYRQRDRLVELIAQGPAADVPACEPESTSQATVTAADKKTS
jgi:NTE family protein